MKEPVMDVIAIVTPDGKTFFCPADRELIVRFWNNWKKSLPLEKHEQYEANNVLGGLVQMRMLESDYARISATSESAKLFN